MMSRGAVVDLVHTVIECQRELRIDYRADSPTMLRRFQMTIQPMRDDRAQMVHDLRDAQTFQQPLDPWHFHANAEAEKCSFCCSVHLRDGNWCWPEALETRHPAEVRYRICPDCAARLREPTKATYTGIIPDKPVVNGFGPIGAFTNNPAPPMGFGRGLRKNRG